MGVDFFSLTLLTENAWYRLEAGYNIYPRVGPYLVQHAGYEAKGEWFCRRGLMPENLMYRHVLKLGLQLPVENTYNCDKMGLKIMSRCWGWLWQQQYSLCKVDALAWEYSSRSQWWVEEVRLWAHCWILQLPSHGCYFVISPTFLPQSDHIACAHLSKKLCCCYRPPQPCCRFASGNYQVARFDSLLPFQVLSFLFDQDNRKLKKISLILTFKFPKKMTIYTQCLACLAIIYSKLFRSETKDEDECGDMDDVKAEATGFDQTLMKPQKMVV